MPQVPRLHRGRWPFVACLAFCALVASTSAIASERLCDPSFENCRTPLLSLINAETIRIDVAFDMMEDTVIANAIITRFKAGVRVRVIMDPRRNSVSSANAEVLQKLKDAGIPMRGKSSGASMHWKFMIFEGQQKLEAGAANFSDYYFIPVQP